MHVNEHVRGTETSKTFHPKSTSGRMSELNLANINLEMIDLISSDYKLAYQLLLDGLFDEGDEVLVIPANVRSIHCLSFMIMVTIDPVDRLAPPSTAAALYVSLSRHK